MFLNRYFVEGLAHASYLFGAAGEAAVVDPKRDVDDYLADAERAGLRIVAVLNTPARPPAPPSARSDGPTGPCSSRIGPSLCGA